MEIRQPTFVKEESVLKTTEPVCDSAQSSALDGFDRGQAKLLKAVGGSPVSC